MMKDLVRIYNILNESRGVILYKLKPVTRGKPNIDLVKETLLKVFKYNTWQEFVDSQQPGECQTIAKAVCRLFPKFKYVSVYINASAEANEALKEESVAIHYLNKLR